MESFSSLNSHLSTSCSGRNLVSPGSTIWDFAHHLSYDDLKVFVVDLHTLHTVDFLDFVDDIFLHFDRTLDSQNVGRGYGSV